MSIRIRNLGRHADGHLIAEVAWDDDWYAVNRQWGSWQLGSREHGDQRDVARPVAAALQSEAIKYERKERKQ